MAKSYLEYTGPAAPSVPLVSMLLSPLLKLLPGAALDHLDGSLADIAMHLKYKNT